MLSGRGQSDAATRSFERARLLAEACSDVGLKVIPRLASDHAEWIRDVVGSEADTGPLGWFFLQRLGVYVDAHIEGQISTGSHEKLVELAALDADEVNAAIAAQGMPPPPPPEWPSSTKAVADGVKRCGIGIIGDPHVGVEASSLMLPAALDSLSKEAIDGAVAIGDLTQNGQEALFVEAFSALTRAPFPIHVTLGNHDMWGGGDAKARGQKFFAQIFSRKPYSLQQHEGCRLIILDSSDPRASPFPPFDLTAGSFTNQPNESVPGGVFSAETLEWLETIEPSGPSFVFLHHPPYPYLGFPPLVFGLDEASTQALRRLNDRVGVSAVFCGHTHRSALTYLGKTPVIEVPSIKEWPFGYGLLEVTDIAWSFNLRPIEAPDAVAKLNSGAGLLFRRYARGPQEARSFSALL